MIIGSLYKFILVDNEKDYNFWRRNAWDLCDNDLVIVIGLGDREGMKWINLLILKNQKTITVSSVSNLWKKFVWLS